MTEKYTGKAMDRRYTGQDIDITYNVKRCIHAEQCIHNLSQVFDNHKRPWIAADGAPADEAARVVTMCPSGALHYERKNGMQEVAPQNIVNLWTNGPLQFSGDLDIEGAVVTLHGESRATLCRCGGSANKPFCDNSHRNNDFDAPDIARTETLCVENPGGKLRIEVLPDGPLRVEGDFAILNTAGEAIFTGSSTRLCRCGHSGNKPFCDGTHGKIEFKAE